MTTRRVNIKKILEDPKKRKEFMVRALIAIQALEGRDLTTEQAEEVYEKIQTEIRQRTTEENPGREIVRNDEESLASAMNTFERFHDKESGTSAYPFNGKKEGIFPLPESVQWPKGVRAWGNAIRTLYESDKWHPKGNTTQYYHDHDKGVTFYTPDDGSDAEPFMHEWPEEVVLLGKCIGFVVQEEDGSIADGIMKGKNILVASPDGWVDPKRPEKVFLAIINLNGGGIEGVICGPNLRITSHGIES